MRFLDLIRVASPFIPKVREPEKPVKFTDKMMWTAWVLMLYLIACQIPLYGIVKQEGNDPMYYLRTILASNSGTLMELGMSPIFTAGFFMQFLMGLNII